MRVTTDDKGPPVNYRRADPTRADEGPHVGSNPSPYAEIQPFGARADTGAKGALLKESRGRAGDSWIVLRCVSPVELGYNSCISARSSR